MTSHRWSEMFAAFAEVLSRNPEERAVYMETALGNDLVLRNAVASLLSDLKEAETEDFLRDPAWVVDDLPLHLPDFRNGDSVFSRIEYLGHGGMGVVYKAYQGIFDRWVALKLCSPHLTTAADRERFRAEAQNMARLRHANIVTVHETGDYEERPYFVMDLIEGTSLEARVGEFRERPQAAAALVQTIALAVHHAHQRRILHNDLKPANILLDENGQPLVTDFGLARRLSQGATASATGAIEGTASYMSPEQAEGREITTATDVYGLGAILYTLLTGAPPFRGNTVGETLDLVRNSRPAPPRQLNTKVDSTLEAICLKCLQKDKALRYASANSLALDIGRYQAGKETLAQPWNRRARFAGWCRRNRVEAGLMAAVVALWIFAGVMALSVAQARKAHLLSAALQSTGYGARDLANTALLQLRSLARPVETAVLDDRVADSLSRRDFTRLNGVLARMCHEQAGLFATCYATDAEGRMVAHVPPAGPIIGENLAWRDYFQGARKLASENRRGSAYVSRVYRGRTDSRFKFAISAAVQRPEGKFLGVVATSVTTDATMGLVTLHDESRRVALLAPRDTDDPAAAAQKDKYVVVFHPAYVRGMDTVELPVLYDRRAKAALASNDQPQLSASSLLIPSDDNYSDPVSVVARDYAGRWIAGFAPVGNTRFVLVVQQRFEEAVSLESSTFWRLALWSALASVVAMAMVAMVLWRWARERPPAGE